MPLPSGPESCSCIRCGSAAGLSHGPDPARPGDPRPPATAQSSAPRKRLHEPLAEWHLPGATSTTQTNPATPVVPVGPLTSIVFEESSYDFGEVMEGEKVVHIYKFKNTGKEPLVISNAKGSCGCTVPDWPREPIAVGASGEIRVQFDSKGKGKVGGGPQAKKVTITANTDPANTFLDIKGVVNKPAES